ncbi:outer dynein arm-docking complex subunit 2-like isoform X2 [Lineus longissimus]|uniref:outer dynein arm-docking complex subunit 2-like isoform X2 n=1 Tax=Lineus longissimus TaxID=88925 RepID=UPI002B4E7A03
MGNTLKRAAQWTSARDGSGGKLEFTPLNAQILNSIIKFCEGYSGGHPEESKIFFKQPLVWDTALEPSHFGGGYSEQGGNMVSDETGGSDNQPTLTLKKKRGGYEVHVSTWEQLENVLKMAGEEKMTEVRSCLEANRDPIANMLGDRFATTEGEDNSAYRFMEEILHSKSGEEGGDDEQVGEKKAALKLLLQLHNLDSKLLQESLSQINNEVRLTPVAVESEVKLIRDYSGEDEDRHVVEYIEFAGVYTYVYANGCRAPPWRQVHGDICYLEIKPLDGDTVFVTASTNGYYENGGFTKEKHELIFDKQGEIERDLVSFLKAKSPKFAENIDKQSFALQTEERDYLDTTADLRDDQDSERMDRHEHKSQRRDHHDQKDDKKEKKKEHKKKKLEPSLKWKNLGIEEHKKEDEKKDKDKDKDDKTLSPRGKRYPIKSSRAQHHDEDEPFSESSSESEEEEESADRRQEVNSDLPSEYWQIQKLVKYLKGGNQTATIIALVSMMDFNLQQETCQLAIRDVGGLEVLINLLDTQEIKCKIGALKILREISKNSQIRRSIADLGGLQTMVRILRDPNKDLKCLAAETIANVAKFRRARRTVRQHGGIRKLVGLLDCVSVATNKGSENEKDIEVARSGALALWSCSKSTKNKQAMRKAGAIPLLAKLLKSTHENMLIPVVGTLQECASEPSYRLAIRTEGMIEDLVKNLDSENQELQMHCASAIFKCAEDQETRDLVRFYAGLDPLVKLLRQNENKELLAAATGAIWKCAISPKNVERFQELKAIDLLVGLLNDQPEEVLVNVVGALGECALDPPNRMAIRKSGGIPPLVQLLTGTNQALLVNDTRAVGQCAEEQENMAIIDRLDGVRLLWSLLKNQNPEVQASAAWAICPCIENAKDAGEMVRSFVGGLELIVSLLKSEDKEVLASVCAAIANIAKDEENLAVITDHGVVPMLARLTNTSDDKLRRHLAEAIARCCSWSNNKIAFGREGAVAPLVKYLKSKDEKVHRSTARALFQLSKDPNNCITMHEAGSVKFLLVMVGSQDEVLQEAAAGCIENIRRLALANEKAKTS